MQEFVCIQKGQSVQLLIHSGTHGDEYEVIDLVTEAVKKYERDLPDYIFVPLVSPSAVAKRTRLNDRNNDVNRIFTERAADPEVIKNMEVFRKGPFDLFVSFHEDPEYSDYYIYDACQGPEDAEIIHDHNRYLSRHGVGLLNGVDDVNDPDLGYEFTDGYRQFVHHPAGSDDGMISNWAFNRNLIKRSLLPEIPGRASLQVKKFIVDSFFERVILCFFPSRQLVI